MNNVHPQLTNSKFLYFYKYIEYTTERLKKLKADLYILSKEARSGNLDKADAADRIIEIHEQIEEILEYLSKNGLSS